MEQYIEQITSQITPLLEQMTGMFPALLGTIIVLILIAFCSYRFLRLELSVSGAIGLGFVGYTYAPLLLAQIQGLPEGIDYSALVGAVCAILGWILAWLLHKIAIFAVGAGAGFSLGTIVFGFIYAAFPDVEFLGTPAFYYIVSIICAIAVGIIFVYLFKPIYIILTSFGGMICAGFLLSFSIFGMAALSGTYLYATLAAGAVLGLIATIVQFSKSSENA